MSVAGTVKARKDGRALGESVLHVIIVKTEGSPRVPPVFPGPGVVVITVVPQLMPVRNVGDWARGRAVQDAEALRRRTALYNRVCG